MPKFIRYQALTYDNRLFRKTKTNSFQIHACTTYRALLEGSKPIEPPHDPPDDPGLSQAFEDPLPTAAIHKHHPNAQSNDMNQDGGVWGGRAQAVYPNSYNEAAIKEFGSHANVGLAYTLRGFFNTKKVDKEFRALADAGLAYLDDNHRCSWKPLDPRNKDVLPDALQMMYVHMGYLPINELVFLDMASLYVEFCFAGCEWEENCCHSVGATWGECWCPCCQRSNTIDQTSIDVLISRDVPTVVTYMHKTNPRLLSIEELAFRDLAEKVEEYREFRGEYHHWSEEAVAAFREFSGPVVDYLTYENDIERMDVTAFKDIAVAVGWAHVIPATAVLPTLPPSAR
jgi:hypothetical protein